VLGADDGGGGGGGGGADSGGGGGCPPPRTRKVSVDFQKQMEELAKAAATTAAVGEGDSDSEYSDEDDDMGEMVAFEDLPKPVPRGRKVSVSASSAKVELNIPPKVVAKTQEEQDGITEMLKQSTIFSHLPAEAQQTLKDAMAKETFKEGETIIKQGDMGDKLFLLKSGEVQVFVEKAGADPVKTYSPGEAFGELALLYNAPRAATCKAVGAVEVWALDQLTFRQVMQSQTSDRRQHYREFLRTMPMFQVTKQPCPDLFHSHRFIFYVLSLLCLKNEKILTLVSVKCFRQCLSTSS
jgi:cAMP-dependent protein kinase regulator